MEVEGYEFFGETYDGSSYDWSVFGVWVKDGQFFWSSDNGCSCNSPWDKINFDFPADFEGPGNVHDVIKALHEWAGGAYQAADSAALLDKLLSYRG